MSETEREKKRENERERDVKDYTKVFARVTERVPINSGRKDSMMRVRYKKEHQ